MSKFWVVVKNELIRYFISPLAYVYLIAFLILNGSFAIYFGHFFVRGQADLLPMFAYQPWLYLLFISGISMRSWAEEFRSKTVVQLVTMPVSVATLVWGKFWAAWIFSALALVLTFPFWVCVNWLGNPDNTVIALGYVASWVLAGCMLSISQLMSALTKNQVIALVLSVVVNLIFFLSGLEYVLAFFRLFAPLSVIDMIASFSFLTHFSTMSAGLFELRDLVFFLSLLFLFNFTTILVVSFKTAGASRLMNSYSRNYYILVFVLMLLGFGGLNLAANNWGRAWRYDFTAEKIYSLSDTTQNLMQNLKHPIIAKLYYSRILEKRNPQLRQMFDRVRLLLSELKRLSNGKFDYKIYYPEVFDAQESQALAQGVLPMPIIDLNQNALFGLTFADDMDNHQVIPFFALEREQFLEQDITEKIFALEHQHKKVGILTSLPMFATEKGNSTATQEWQIIKQIRNFFDVAQVIEPKDIDGIDVLMIVHPLNLSQEMKDKIIDYSFNGGKVLLFADAAPEASRLYALVNDDIVPSQVADLAKIWGIQFHPEAVVADLANSVLVDATQNYNTNPTFTQDLLQYVFKKKNFNPNEPSISGLKDIMMASAMVVEPLQAAQNRIEFIPLISASSQSQVIPAVAALENFPADVILQRFQADDYPKVLAAKVISMNREAPFEVVAVGDTDMLYDAFWAKQNQWLDTTYVVPLLDNANFVLNILEELSGSESLAGLRGHAQLRRPFNHIEQMRKNNEREAKVKEAKILEQINQEKEKLQDGQFVKYAGIITSVKKKFTKTNKIMAFVTVEDLYGTCEVIVFESCYNNCSNLLLEESIVAIDGRVSLKEDADASIIANSIVDVEDEEGLKNMMNRGFRRNYANSSYNINSRATSSNDSNYMNSSDVANTIEHDLASIPKRKKLTMDITNLDEVNKEKLRGAIRFFTGDRNNTPVFVKQGEKLSSCGAIFADDEILQEFAEIVGKENVAYD